MYFNYILPVVVGNEDTTPDVWGVIVNVTEGGVVLSVWDSVDRGAMVEGPGVWILSGQGQASISCISSIAMSPV